jgi:hypothetical protein
MGPALIEAAIPTASEKCTSRLRSDQRAAQSEEGQDADPRGPKRDAHRLGRLLPQAGARRRPAVHAQGNGTRGGRPEVRTARGTDSLRSGAGHHPGRDPDAHWRIGQPSRRPRSPRIGC